MATLDFIIFQKAFVEPQLIGTLDSSLTSEQLQALTYLVIGDCRARGLVDIGPAPTLTSTELSPITQLTATNEAAWPLLASGIRYFLVSDPINNLKTTLSLDVGKDKDLVESLRLRFYELLDAYFKIYHCDLDPCAVYSDLGSGGAGDDKCCLTLEEQILLDQAKTKSKIKLLDTTRAYKLDDRDFYLNRKADNAVKTLAGPFAISYLTEYEEELLPSVTNEIEITEADLNFTDTIISSTQIYTSRLIDTTLHDIFEFTIVSDEPITATFFQLINNSSQFEQVELPVTSDLIFRKYYLRDTNFIRLVLEGITDNTKFYIKGNLR